MNNKIIINIFKIILFPTIILLITLFIFYKYVPNTDYETLKITGYSQEENDNLNVVITGDSSVYNGFIPAVLYKEYGYTSYNSGQVAQKINQTYELVKDIYKYQTPDIIIIETTEFCMPIENRNYKIKTYNKREKFYNNHSFLRKQKTLNEYLVNKGYTFCDTVRGIKKTGYLKENDQMVIWDENLGYIKKIISFVQKHGSKLVFISLPASDHSNEKTQRQLEKIFEKQDIPFIDFNYPEKLENYNNQIDLSNDTHDFGVHLNVYGAQKVTRYIGQYISEHYKLSKNDACDEYEEHVDKFYKKYGKYLNK